MPDIREIKRRMKSVGDTRKVTDAMYRISSIKLSKAKSDLDRTRPFFNELRKEIKRIFRHAPNIINRYFYPPEGSEKLNGTFGCLIITADKGLAGAYNHNVLKLAEEMHKQHEDMRFYVVGEVGRQYFRGRNLVMEPDFEYTAQRPTLERARQICARLLEDYDAKLIDKLFIIYTDFKNGMSSEAVEFRLLPFHRAQFTDAMDDPDDVSFEPFPSLEAVLENIIPSYIGGFVYSALVDSYCSEQNARMSAMQMSGRNADKMLEKLRISYNRVRQGQITAEITELASGARALKNHGKIK